MKARKIVLLSLIAVLLCVYILQLVSVGKGSVKQISMAGEPDRLILESKANGKIILTKVGDDWYLGDRQQYETLSSEVDILVNALRSYSVMQTVSSGGDEILYGLDDDSRISVTAYQGDEILCQIDVGKDASTVRQSYIRMAGEKGILLVSDSFNNVFNITQDDVRKKSVYMLSEDDITDAALVTKDAGVIMVSRADDGTWFGNYEQMTPNGIETWISSISMLNAAGWLPDDWQPSAEAEAVITLKLKDRVVTNLIYPIEGDEDRYIGTSTECPYAFYLSAYTVGKFFRTAADFGD